MTRQPLPLRDPSRTEFGFARSICACPACRVFCHYVPGFLVPSDLERLLQEIRKVANVATRTTVVLSTPFEARPPKVS